MQVVYIRKTPNVGSGIGALQRGRQSERERLSRVDRIENPVVPQARRGVVGRAFVLVLLENRLAERLFFFRRERLALRAPAGRA